MDFKHIPEKYRPIPFWSWNEKLDADETVRQVRIMKEAGIGGFFMHARGGLQTEYMGDEWFLNIEKAANEAKRNSMYAWAYDENGWPSGFGDGKVNGLGVEYQQKYLRVSLDKPHENIIAHVGEYWLYYEVNPFYVDVLDKKVIKKFIDVAYKPYWERFKNDITGFFTDEPQVSRNGIPWSFVMESEYNTRYGENLTDILPSLFYRYGDYKKARVQFWAMVTDLFSESYMKQIYDWCNTHKLKLTGHLTLEETLISQVQTHGACMPHYEYFHIPGIDWLGRNIYDCLIHYQVSSAAQQLGKEQVLCEAYAMCGHSVSFEELKRIYDWLAVRGINLLCQHLEGYSLRGMRKRDYPPAMFYQQPWWSEYRGFIDNVSRESMILSQGEDKCDILLIHPQTTVWSLYNGSNNNDEIQKLNDEFLRVIKCLEQKHIIFHLGDETLIKRHGRVENNEFIIGNKRYKTVLNPCGEVLFESTQKLLNEFASNGGVITEVENLDMSNVCESDDITYTVRYFNGFKVHFFVNSTDKTIKTHLNVNGRIIDGTSGELTELYGEHTFYPYQSIMIYDNGVLKAESGEKKENRICMSDKVYLCEKLNNMLTLDKCDYYFDGELNEKNGYVLNICERANRLKRPVNIHQDYYFTIDGYTDDLYLVCETPEKFTVKVNGTPVTKEVCGYVTDRCFKKINITEYIKQGGNTVSFDCNFMQSQDTYQSIEKAYIFESERNKLAYDFEIEPIYLYGTFGIKCSGEWKKLNNNAVRYTGDFIISNQAKQISLKNIEMQGFPFFCGGIKFKTQINVCGENPVIVFNKKGINVIKIKIGDTTKTYYDSVIKLNDFNVTGTVDAEISLINNLRNLMGPHHINIGESFAVWPGSFVKEKCLWDKGTPEKNWNDDYCFIETGI